MVNAILLLHIPARQRTSENLDTRRLKQMITGTVSLDGFQYSDFH